jgi:hypothetical protein
VRANPEKGMSIVAMNKKGRNTPQYYAVAANPEYGKSPVRKYLGTGNTISEERLRAGAKFAAKARKQLIEDHKAKHGLR